MHYMCILYIYEYSISINIYLHGYTYITETLTLSPANTAIRKGIMGCGGLRTGDTSISGRPGSSKHISKLNRGNQDPHYPGGSLLNMPFLAEIIHSLSTGLETVFASVVINCSLIKMDLLSTHTAQSLY